MPVFPKVYKIYYIIIAYSILYKHCAFPTYAIFAARANERIHSYSPDDFKNKSFCFLLLRIYEI